MISVVRDGKAEAPDDGMQLEPGDSVLTLIQPGKEEELRKLLDPE
jgi:Trk K+ transport system NAD-binding subunit